MEDIFGGICDLFSGILDWTPTVIDVAEEFIPDGETEARKRKPEDDEETVDG